ncbi:MAG: DEAD/DEAH box helicase, partial [Planctomycetota bacterium]
MDFAQLPLAEPILQAVADCGYVTASPIQAQTIPHTLEGRDVLGCAQTGTGKTAAFALPTLHRMHTDKRQPGKRLPRGLVLAPTRELAGQIAQSFQDYGQRIDLASVLVYGGVNQNPQITKLNRGVDLIIATPGRLIDLMEQGHVDLSRVQTFILDEADRMLDMGFIPDIRKINKKIPKSRQTLLFSATMPPAIEKLANDLLTNPVKISTAPQSTTAERVEQAVYFVDKGHKPQMLAHLLGKHSVSRAIVFTRTKYGADKLVRRLKKFNFPAEAIHGNKTQNARLRSLERFKSGKCHVLVATDIASRGIDVDNVSHVFNYDLPDDPESYVHRIGRTARAGASGMAIAFCDKLERANLTAVQRAIKMKLPVLTDFPDDIPEGEAAKLPDDTPSPKRQQRGKNQGQGKPRRGGDGGQGQAKSSKSS